MVENKIPVLAVVGPTASGKTRLGAELALRLDGEVVSADSMQIYEGLDVAAAKPTEEEKRGVPHHLIGFVPLGESYSVARYVEDASRVIREVRARGKLPILVGGTGLYLSSLLDNVRFAEEDGNPALREELRAFAGREGAGALHARLMEIDPDYAAALHPNNLGRVIRAIEIYETTGKPMSIHLRESRSVPSPYRPVMLGLTFRDRQKLYDRIGERVGRMVQDGLVEEARSAVSLAGATAAQAIGCKELAPYLEGRTPLEICLEELKKATRRYAKRQLSWFRRDGRIHWLLADDFERFEDLAGEAVRYVEATLRDKAETRSDETTETR